MQNLKSTRLMLVITISFLFAACNGGSNQNEKAETGMEEGMGSGNMNDNRMEEMLAGYMDIKEALFNDDAKKVQDEAKEMMEKEGMAAEIKSNVSQIANTSDLEQQRKHFADLSEQLYPIVQNSEEVDKNLYVAKCPMAMNNKGARWLSYEEQIRNPYMGQRMPRCGSVEETIKK